MILVSGDIAKAFCDQQSIGSINTPSKIMITSIILCHLVEKTDRTDPNRAIVKEQYIKDQLGYLGWANVQILSHHSDCVFQFFNTAIAETLAYYNIDLNIAIETLVECSSCGELSIINPSITNCLAVIESHVNDTLDVVVAELFKDTEPKCVCPKCFIESTHKKTMLIGSCPKHLFVYCHLPAASNTSLFKLTPHVNISQIITDNVIYTNSYSRYTLQAFITFNEKNNTRHYFTYARYKEDWYCINDMDVKVVQSASIFGDENKRLPIVLAHYTRPSETDVFSTALFNIFSNFSPQKISLPPTLSLNEAVNYFAKNNIFNYNPLNLAVLKYLDCSKCKKGKSSL